MGFTSDDLAAHQKLFGTLDGGGSEIVPPQPASAPLPQQPVRSSLPQGAAPAPQSASSAELQGAGQGSDLASQSAALMKEHGIESTPSFASASMGASDGSSPEAAIQDHSPLSYIQQGMLGWARTPSEQVKMLKQTFEDGTFVQKGNTGYLAVKDKGQWHEAVPNFEWSLNPITAAGGMASGAIAGPMGAIAGGVVGAVAPSFFDKKNLSRLPQQMAYDVGEYGLRSLGAVAAGAAAAASGGAAIPVMAAAGVGAAGAEGLDLASRAALNNPASPGARPYTSSSEVATQLASSWLFGATQELGSKMSNYVLSKPIEALATTFRTLSDSPGGNVTLRKLSQMLPLHGLANDPTVETFLQNPGRAARFLEVAGKDVELGKQAGGGISAITDNLFQSVQDQMDGLHDSAGREFMKLASDPRVKGATFDVSTPLNAALERYEQGGYIRAIKNPDDSLKQYVMVQNPLAGFFSGDKAAVMRALQLQGKASSLSYAEARQLVQGIGGQLNEGVSTNAVFGALAKFKSGINDTLTQGLESLGEDAGLGKQYASILGKYKAVAQLGEDLGRVTDGPVSKKIAFVTKLSAVEENAGQELQRQLVDAGMDGDTLNAMQQAKAAQAMSAIVARPGYIQKFLPNGAKVQLGIAQGAQAVRSVLKPVSPVMEAALPYLDKSTRLLRNMPPANRASMLSTPQTLDTIIQTAAQSGMLEEAKKQALLRGLGVIGQGGPGGAANVTGTQ